MFLKECNVFVCLPIDYDKSSSDLYSYPARVSFIVTLVPMPHRQMPRYSLAM